MTDANMTERLRAWTDEAYRRFPDNDPYPENRGPIRYAFIEGARWSTAALIDSLQRERDAWQNASPHITAHAAKIADERDAARKWLTACLGLVEGRGPPNWDGIRAFLKGDTTT